MKLCKRQDFSKSVIPILMIQTGVKLQLKERFGSAIVGKKENEQRPPLLRIRLKINAIQVRVSLL